jgi:hypothetical protein
MQIHKNEELWIETKLRGIYDCKGRYGIKMNLIKS